MKTVRVELGQHSYDVAIAAGLLDDLGGTVRACAHGRAAFLITDSNVGPLYAKRALASLEAAGLAVHLTTFAAGERHKTLVTASALFDDLFAAPTPPDRSSVVVALGGGVVGDVAGFVAATLLRGVPFVQAPTTLLADVDSSVGGKTGVDHAAGKNLIGAFHQPRAVVIDPQLLFTLPTVELSSGLAECVKHGIIRDASLLDWIAQHADALMAGRDGDLLAELIARNVAVKAAVVAEDERERDQGPRTHLNFGHTIGHAIEAAYGFGADREDYLRHGHCVALGMVAANQIAVGRGLLAAAAAARVENLLTRLRLPVRLGGLDAESLLSTMRHDKKARAGLLRFVLPAGRLGAVAVHEDVGAHEIRAAIDSLAG
jgi:3-dehydroquinate synthase